MGYGKNLIFFATINQSIEEKAQISSDILIYVILIITLPILSIGHENHATYKMHMPLMGEGQGVQIYEEARA